MTGTAAVVSECTRCVPCVDCDDTSCWLQGKKESNCPKYRCDNPTHDCESKCAFIDNVIAEMRGEEE